MHAIDHFMGNFEDAWISGQDAAQKIANRSGEGKAPIGLLFLVGHNFGGNTGTSIGNNVGGLKFSADDLFAVAKEQDNSSNTYKSAVNKVGPPKCWFTREGDVYGFGCNTHPGWTTDWANKIMRISSTAKGAETLVYAEFYNQRLTSNAFTKFEGMQDQYNSVSALIDSNYWKSVKGTQ